MRALLDTHVLLYWLDRPSELSHAQRKALAGCSEANPALVADISLWEIATLVSLGRLRLRLPLRDWLEAATAPPLVRRVSLTPAVAAEVAALPEAFQRDPADRIIVASARVTGSTLLTQDRRIIDAGIVATA